MFIDSNLKRINIDAPYECEHGNRYANLRDPVIREEHGIVEIPDPEKKNPKFYFVQETVDAPYVINTPKDVEGLKSSLSSEVRQTAFTLLQPTDYQITRISEQIINGTTPDVLDTDIATYRAGVRAAYAALEAAIAAATTVADLEAINYSAWPSAALPEEPAV